LFLFNIIKIHRKLLLASKDVGLTEFSFDNGFLGHKENLVFRCVKNAEHF